MTTQDPDLTAALSPPDASAAIDAFRALHRRGAGFLIPNAWDAGSACILSSLGFEAIATTSAGLAWSLARRDGAVGREEAIANAHAIVGATSLPVSADLENGFGPEPEAVALTIRLASGAGLAGASIEDASGDADAPIYDFEHALDRMHAAVDANRAMPVPLVLTGRAENFLHGRPDLDDTIRRLAAFEAAGADVLYAPGLPTLEAIREVCAALDRPVNVLAGGGRPAWTAADLFAAGACRISVGSGLARAALSAFIGAAREMRDVGGFGFTACRPDYADVNRLMAGEVGSTGA